MRKDELTRIARQVACGVLTLSVLSAANSAFAAVLAVSATPLRASILRSSLPAPVYRTVAVALGGKLYLLGGLDPAGVTLSSVDVFSPATGGVGAGGSLALPTHGSAAAVVGGRVLDFGGASSVVHDTVQYFDPATSKATTIASLPAPRADTTAATSGPTTVLVGGFNGIGPQSDVWATANGVTFRVLAHLPQPVRYPAAVASGGIVYVFGGLISGGEYSGLFSSDIQAVNLASEAARIVGHLPSPLAHAMAASIGGHLYVIGGSTPAGTSAQILEFLPSRGLVLAAGRLPEPLTDAGSATTGDRAYLLGGLSSNGPSARIAVLRLAR